jgi:hypothetical protein
MSWLFGGPPQPGDWIKTTKLVKVGLTDYLLGDDAGIPPGTRGVITEASGIFSTILTARLDGGLFGPVTVRVRAHEVRVVRRNGGIEAYKENAQKRTIVRVAAVIAMFGPILVFAIKYLAAGGSKGGLLVAMLKGVVYGTLDTIEYVLTNPVKGLLYCAIVWLIGRIALGRW